LHPKISLSPASKAIGNPEFATVMKVLWRWGCHYILKLRINNSEPSKKCFLELPRLPFEISREDTFLPVALGAGTISRRTVGRISLYSRNIKRADYIGFSKKRPNVQEIQEFSLPYEHVKELHNSELNNS
jgi:hypothetical protein